jgi:hypothetical protein
VVEAAVVARVVGLAEAVDSTALAPADRVPVALAAPVPVALVAPAAGIYVATIAARSAA